ncbi:MAG: glycosyltransferase family 4 protein [candidate division WOR-3 bacterium]
MKIAIFPMFYPPSYGSGPILMEELAKSLALRGHKVTVITTQPEKGKWRRGFVSTELKDNLKIKRTRTYLSKEGPKRFLSWLHYSLYSLFLSLGEKYDVAFFRSPPPTLAITGYILKKLKGAHFVLNVQDIHPDLAINSGILRNPFLIKLAKEFEKWAYKKSDVIVVISEGFKENLIAKGVPKEKIKVIPNWVDTDFITPLPKNNPLSQQLNLNKSFVIMHAGTLTVTNFKALSALLEVAQELKDEDLIFALVGGGLCKADLKEKANELALKNVRFYPFQPLEDLPLLMASADVLVVALDPDKSVSSVPSKLYNIMAAGRPALGLVHPDSETASIIRDTNCGVIADPRNKKEILKAILELMRNKKLREKLGENGRLEAIEEYSKEVVLKKYKQFLENI